MFFLGEAFLLMINLLFRISCRNNWPTGKFIDIKDAMFGRSEGITCPHEAMSNRNCKASNALEKVQEA